MKRKTSILINIASLCLCICALAFGVISAKTVTASLGGSIGFKAYNCNVDVKGTITGAVLSTASTNKVSSSPTLYLHPTGEPTSSNTNTTISINGDSQSTYDSISFGNLGFAVNSSTLLPYDITLTFSITNQSEFPVCASLSLDDFNIDPSITYLANEYKLKLGDKNSSTKTSEFTITLKAGSTSVNATSDTSKINFTFEKYNVPKLADAGFAGTINGTEITLTGVPSGSGTLVIPAYFSDTSDNLCKVTTLQGSSSSAMTNVGGYSSITISDGVEQIDTGAFRSCTSLSSITIPNSVTSIGYNALLGCTSLTSIAIPNNVTTIGIGAFNNGGLTSVVIPQNVTSVGSAGFTSCPLVTITIKGDTMFNYPNFTGNTALTTVILEGNATFGSSTPFLNCTNLATFYIKNGISVPEFVSSDYTQLSTSDKAGFSKWSKNS